MRGCARKSEQGRQSSVCTLRREGHLLRGGGGGAQKVPQIQDETEAQGRGAHIPLPERLDTCLVPSLDRGGVPSSKQRRKSGVNARARSRSASPRLGPARGAAVCKAEGKAGRQAGAAPPPDEPRQKVHLLAQRSPRCCTASPHRSHQPLRRMKATKRCPSPFSSRTRGSRGCSKMVRTSGRSRGAPDRSRSRWQYKPERSGFSAGPGEASGSRKARLAPTTTAAAPSPGSRRCPLGCDSPCPVSAPLAGRLPQASGRSVPPRTPAGVRSCPARDSPSPSGPPPSAAWGSCGCLCLGCCCGFMSGAAARWRSFFLSLALRLCRKRCCSFSSSSGHGYCPMAGEAMAMVSGQAAAATCRRVASSAGALRRDLRSLRRRQRVERARRRCLAPAREAKEGARLAGRPGARARSPRSRRPHPLTWKSFALRAESRGEMLATRDAPLAARGRSRSGGVGPGPAGPVPGRASSQATAEAEGRPPRREPRSPLLRWRSDKNKKLVRAQSAFPRRR